MFHAFRIGLGVVGRDPDGKKQLDHEAMPHVHAINEFAAQIC